MQTNTIIVDFVNFFPGQQGHGPQSYDSTANDFVVYSSTPHPVSHTHTHAHTPHTHTPHTSHTQAHSYLLLYEGSEVRTLQCFRCMFAFVAFWNSTR